jgi:hypothetical protein
VLSLLPVAVGLLLPLLWRTYPGRLELHDHGHGKISVNLVHSPTTDE